MEKVDIFYLNFLLQKLLKKNYIGKNVVDTEKNKIFNFFEFKIYRNFEIKFSIFNIEFAFNLDFNVPSPIKFCSQKNLIEIYSTVFKKLLKWKIYQNLNNKIFLF